MKSKLNQALLFVSILLFPMAVKGQSEKNKFTGYWLGEKMDNVVIKMYLAKDGFYYGKIVKSDKEEKIGKLVIKTCVYDPESNNYKGIMTPPHMNVNIDAVFTFNNEDNLKMVGTKVFMTKTFYFKRITKPY